MDTAVGFVKIAFSSIIVYLFMIAAIRLFGKKELAQLSVVDLVFILLISNSVQNAMVGSNNTLLGGLAAATSLFVINYIFKYIIYKYPHISKLLQGEPIMLVYKGSINKDNLARAKVSMIELEEAAREHGVPNISDVDLAILELDGNISILSHEFSKKSSKKRKAVRTNQAVKNS